MFVKGCTTALFWLMDFAHGASDRRLSHVVAGPIFSYCRPAGRMNASTADHARAWLQGEDRLETARDRCESPHHHICGYPPGADAEGRRHRRDPDCADRYCAAPDRAGGAVRGLRLLHIDL